MMTGKQILQSTLRGNPTGITPSAPLYLGGLYCEPIRRKKMAEVFREMAGGRSEITLTFDDHLDAELEAWQRTWDEFETPPDWMRCRFGTSRSAAEGSTVTISDQRCIWRSADGSRQIDYAADYDASKASSQDVWDKEVTISDESEIEQLIPVSSPDSWLEDGRTEFISRAIKRWGDEVLLQCITGTPFWGGYSVFGFAGLMHMVRREPDILRKILRRVLKARLALIEAYSRMGLPCLFVEECFTGSDIISVEDYEHLAWPTVRDLLDEAVKMGFLVVFYPTGAIEGRLPFFARCSAQALAFEEEKKNIVIDLAEIRKAVGPDRAIFGNLDVTVLRDAPKATIVEAIRSEKEQAGEPFVASVGSPITLDTPPERVSWITQAAREISSSA